MPLIINNTDYRSPNVARDPQGRIRVRPGPIDSLVLHTGEGTKASDLGWLCSPASGVSSHFYVDRSGNVYQLMELKFIANHAGEAWYNWRRNWNARSIGIETEHKKGQDWPRVQLDAVVELGRLLVNTYKIQRKWIAGHRQVAWPRGRKYDPTDLTNAQLDALINSFYTHLTFRVKLSSVLGANVRKEPTSTSAAIGAVWPRQQFRGTIVYGERVSGEDRWAKRLEADGGGYVWFRNLELL